MGENVVSMIVIDSSELEFDNIYDGFYVLWPRENIKRERGKRWKSYGNECASLQEEETASKNNWRKQEKERETTKQHFIKRERDR